MTHPQLRPERITKPIQLLAAWLAGLVLVDSAFLTAASFLEAPTWAAGILVIASVCNVPVFIGALFLLQTRFRPEMQEDPFYSHYLERRYSSSEATPAFDITEFSAQLTKEIAATLEARNSGPRPKTPLEDVVRKAAVEELARRNRPSRTVAELYLRPDLWGKMTQLYAGSGEIERDIEQLKADGLVAMRSTTDLTSASLTPLGREVAALLGQRRELWSDDHQEHWETDAARARTN